MLQARQGVLAEPKWFFLLGFGLAGEMRGSSGELGSSSDLQEGSSSPGSRASESGVHTMFWKQTDGLSRLGRRRQRLKAGRQKCLDAALQSRRLTWPGVARGGRPWLRGHRAGLRDACVTAAEQLLLSKLPSASSMSDGCLGASEVSPGGFCAAPRAPEAKIRRFGCLHAA